MVLSEDSRRAQEGLSTGDSRPIDNNLALRSALIRCLELGRIRDLDFQRAQRDSKVSLLVSLFAAVVVDVGLGHCTCDWRSRQSMDYAGASVDAQIRERG